MPPVVTFAPASPRGALDGIDVTVTGQVSAKARLLVRRGTKVVGMSPEFAQDSPYRNAQVSILITGGPTGGTWTMTFSGGATGTTAGIPYNATAAQIESAIESVAGIGTRTVRVAGDCPGPIIIEFEGEKGDRAIAVSAADTMTGGTNPTAVVTTVAAGGRTTDAIASLIMQSLLLPTGSYVLDLVYVGGPTDGNVMATVNMTVVAPS
jgi:hypothetical protein